MDFQLFIPMLPSIFGGKNGKMLVDQVRSTKILSDFLSFFKKSVEFLAPNTDWPLYVCHAVYSAQMIVTVLWLLITR